MRRQVTTVLLLLAGLAMGCHSHGDDQSELPIANLGERPDDVLHMVAHGVHTRLTYKATQPGTVYLYDFDTGQKLFSEHLETNQTFTVEPDGRATIDKQPVTLEHLTNATDDYRLYFAREDLK